MSVQIFKYWDRVRSSFWFLPAVMVGGAVVLSFVTVALDERVTDRWLLALSWTFSGGSKGASSVLTVVAGSMITLAGVVFSMTLVALSLASSQLGPRLLRNFMRDTPTQLVLGTFVATFLYCLLVLRTIRHADEIAFVPQLSVTLGILFAVLSVGVLIYFIHHVAVSIQVDEIVARVSTELVEGLDRLFPEHIGRAGQRMSQAPPDSGFLDAFDLEACPACAVDDGYVQVIDEDTLMALATQNDVVIRLERRPGHYVVAGRPLVLVWPASRVTDSLADEIISAFVLGSQRTVGQDFEFSVNQLVEIAVRALSPGVNDPFTAVTCVDRLGSVLCRLVVRDKPSPYRYDKQDRLRVIAFPTTFPAITDAAFNQIRQYGRSSAAVTIRLLETIAVVARVAPRPEDRAALIRHAEMIVRGASDGLPEAEDRRKVEERYQTAIQLGSDQEGTACELYPSIKII